MGYQKGSGGFVPYDFIHPQFYSNLRPLFEGLLKILYLVPRFFVFFAAAYEVFLGVRDRVKVIRWHRPLVPLIRTEVFASVFMTRYSGSENKSHR